MKAVVGLWLATIGTASAWQLAIGAGAEWAQVAGMRNGVNGTVVVSRQPFAGRRLSFAAGIARLATPAGAPMIQTLTIWRLRCLWAWRVPLSYTFRPWLGVGTGVDRVIAGPCYRVDASGYAISRAPAAASWLPIWTIAAVAPLPAHLALRISLASAIGAPPLSTVAASLLWRIF